MADLNGDGFPDVFLVTDHPLGQNCVWLNNQNGTFSRSSSTIILKSTRSTFGITRYAPASDVALGDVNGDGFPDAFIAASSIFSVGNQVWLNDGRGNFTRSRDSGIQFSGKSVRLADLNGDGFLDAVIAHDETGSDGYQAVRVWINDGGGQFTSTGQAFGIPKSDLVVLGDVNRDGNVDAVIMASASFSESTPQVWLNDGSGRFTAGQQLAAGYFVGAVLTDFNADGTLDLALASKYGDNEVWLNDGNGNFNQSSEYTGHASTGIAVADINGDGAVDLLASGFDNQIFINVRRPAAGTPPSFTINENESLQFSLPNTLLSTASSPNGGVLKVDTNQTVHFRGTLGQIWYTFGFGVNTDYEGVWPNGSYVYTYDTRVFANHGTLLLEPDGTFTYQPDPYYFGPDSFTYQVNDGVVDSLPVTVNITVNQVPQVPVANRDWYTRFKSDFIPGSGSLYFIERAAGAGVLTNDVDFHHEPLTAVLDSLPAHGSLTFNPDGSFRYVPSSPTFTPYAGPPGLDQFTYHVTNGYYASPPTVVSFGYAAPIAFPDEYALVPDQPLVVDAVNGVLANDTVPNLSADPNLKIFAVLRDPPSHGEVQLDASGSFIYTPNPGYTGGDVFTYTAHDFLAGSGVARVKVGNTSPVAVDDTNYLSFNGKALTITAAQGVLANDTDADGDSLTSVLVSDVSHGSLQLNTDGSFTYTPSAGYSGLDSFTYHASDGRTSSTTATATIRTANFLDVVSSSPARNGLNAPTNTEMVITFNSPLVAASVSGRVTVNGSLTGRRAFSTSVNGPELHLQFESALWPGELVMVHLLPGIQGANFYELERNYASQFQAVAPRGGAVFTRTVAGTTTTSFSHSVVLGDLNGDGFPDAFIANRYSLPTLLMNNRDRTFTERNESLGLHYPPVFDVAPVLADLNGDGRPDLVAAGQMDSIFGPSPKIAVGLNDGTGHFPVTKTLSVFGPTGAIYNPSFMLAADVDGNGTVDLLGANIERFVVWRNDGAGNFTLDESTSVLLRNLGVGGSIGDVNNDGYLDVYLVGFGGDQLLINDGTGHFEASNQALNTSYATGVALADVDGDGSLDAVLATQYPIGNQIWLNDGAGHFHKSLHEITLSTTISLALGDLDADGSLDLWQANATDGLGNGGGDAVWTSDGTGRFNRSGPLWGTSSSRDVAIADLDGDGDLDVFVANDSEGGGSPGVGNEVWFNQSLPIAREDLYAANGSSPVVVPASGVLANDTAGDNGPISAVLDMAPAKGSIALNPNGGFTYTPGGGFTGTDVFTYRAQDSATGSVPARVKIGNTAPIANHDGPLLVVNDAPFKLAAPGVLANDTDGEGDPLYALLVAPPTHGSLVLKPNGSFSYTPNSGSTGPDSFTYRTTDGFATSSVATVSLDVRALLRVLSVAPVPGSVSIPANSSIAVQFNHPLNESSLGANVTILGSFTGPRAFSHVLSGHNLLLTPTQPFLTSEQVTLLFADGLQGTSGESLASGYQARFIAEAPTGDGNFRDSGQRIGDTNYYSPMIALGDLNGDGFLDALIPNLPASILPPVIRGKMNIWTNDGSGVFVDTGRILGTNTSAMAVLGDINGDGTLDVIYRFNGAGTGFEVWINDGTSHFSRSAEVFSTNLITGLALADMNGDGSLDLVVLGSAALRIFLNDGAGHFNENPASVQSLSFNNQTFAKVVATDLNGDGTMDLVLQDLVSFRSSRVLINDGHGILGDTGQRFGAGTAMAVGDVNGDGFPDLFLPAVNGPYLWLNDGTGFFADSGKVYPNLYVKDVQLADVNGDRTLDAIVIQYNIVGGPLTNLSTIYLNDGAGNFTDSRTRFDS